MNTGGHIILATAAFPALEYILAIKNAESFAIDMDERYIKQSNRNRYHIAAPNGLQSLTIPIKHHKIYDTTTKCVAINYAMPWQMQHWRSIVTAYNRSAFFEYYADELKEILFAPHILLHQLNAEVLTFLLKTFFIEKPLFGAANAASKWQHISSAKANEQITTIPLPTYTQAFASKYAHIPNLSALDYLFCCGNKL